MEEYEYQNTKTRRTDLIEKYYMDKDSREIEKVKRVRKINKDQNQEDWGHGISKR